MRRDERSLDATEDVLALIDGDEVGDNEGRGVGLGEGDVQREGLLIRAGKG